jgi:HAD superfamily hydrolase (TIGR01509 family)
MILQIPEGDFAAYIFDCDGTLADTMPLHYKAWCAALRDHECDFPEAFFYELGGVPTVQIVELLNERHGYKMPSKEIAHAKEQLYLEMVAQIGPIEPVVAIVHEFYGRLPMAVASGGRRSIVVKTLDALGLVDKFEAIIGSEDYVNGKPAPDPFLTAAARLGVEPAKCLVFEDTRIGTTAAEAAGMQWVLVPPLPRGAFPA